MSNKNYEEKYTEPELREQIKDDLMESDKGGKPGQWSARKSQMLVKEYEKQGGGYKQHQKDEAAESLETWSDQNWQTQDGDSSARDGQTTKRYLPQGVWERLSRKEKEEVEKLKEEASQQGQQHVEWTPAVKRAMQEIEHSSHDESTKQELYDQAKDLKIQGRSKMSKEELQAAIHEAQH